MAWTPLPRPDERFRTRPKAVSKSPGVLDTWTPKPKVKIAPAVLEALPDPPAAALPVSSASARLRAALEYEDAEAAEVKSFLRANGFHQYVAAFMENGFDCMEVVEEMEERHMKDLGMKPGHIIKLKLRLASSRGEAPSSAGGTPQRQSLIPEVGAAASPLVLPLPATKPAAATSAASSPGASLLHGQLDEEAEAIAFQEAVAAWRNAGQPKMTRDEQIMEQPGRAETTTVPSAPAAVKKCCYQCFRALGAWVHPSHRTDATVATRPLPHMFRPARLYLLQSRVVCSHWLSSLIGYLSNNAGLGSKR
ncbi:unnamed protein product [Cladocopium goreaui]|uniref:SAM domain-containing protein n=1 Tax=Cladocopium goreaui TaxID=2562237 RepID=A0A9P1D4X5_9DINO|nr:unnamed protein product [Cladocopium goreaui]